jgi:hypothetical protein
MTKRRLLITLAALVAVVAVGWLVPLLREEPAEAALSSTASLDDYGKYVTGSAPLNLRLMALDKLRKKTDSGVEAQLDAVARSDNKVIAIYATGALGRKKTASAKAKLKALLESASVDMNVRIGALSAIAIHWKDADDRSYLDDKSKGNSRLAARFAWLDTNVYER